MSALAVFLLAELLPGVSVDSYLSCLLVAVALAFLNAVVKPVLTVLTIPVTIVSLGLFLLVINALMIIIAEKLVEGFYVDGFWWALFFSLLLSLLTGLLNVLLGVKKEEQD